MKDKYVFIVSRDTDDSTNMVIKWLHHYGLKVIRMGDSNWIETLEIIKKDNQILVSFSTSNGLNFEMDQIIAFWYRKSVLPLFKKLKLKLPDVYFNLTYKYEEYLEKDELAAIEKFLIFEFETKNYIGNINAKNGNKLISFRVAEEVGFKTPDFLISTCLNSLKNYALCDENIVKPIQDGFRSFNDEVLFKNYYSNELSSNFFENSSSTIFPSCIQKYISKKIEIRTFYLKGETYSMAIFSQSNEETSVDFRNYSETKPNRNVPFLLPELISEKVDKFMKKMSLNTGSIDLILTPDNEYYFLEVNPAGQYGMVESACFYGLDKIIANGLLNNN